MHHLQPIIGILSEIQSPWERRVALTPKGCSELIGKGIRIIIQPSKIRCFSDDEYLDVGCEVQQDLNICNLIVGLQEPSINYLLPEKTYLIFSHCKKGKTENKAFLEKILEKKIRLIDYECIKEDLPDRSKAKRKVSFGKIAGIAGTINLFKGIGELLLARQVSTPFIFTKLSYMYAWIENAISGLKTLGNYITEQYLPLEYTPFTIAVLGKGQVSIGVIEALQCLPYKYLTPKELIEENYEKKQNLIYIVSFGIEDLYVDENSHFDSNDFQTSPENYTSIFIPKYLSYFNAIINCLYWDSRHPRILTKSQLKDQVAKNKVKLIGISDISCDINGSIEILQHYTTFQKPYFIYEPIIEKELYHVDQSTKEGLIYTAIPNLAASFSIDASEHFSRLLLPYIDNLVYSKYPASFEDQTDLLNELRNACICSNGVLTPRYKNIFKNTETKKKFELSKTEQEDRPYYMSFKMKGHLFDSGFFLNLVDNINRYGVGHKIGFLSIGEGWDMHSTLYFDIFGQTVDDITSFLSYLKNNCESLKIEYEIMKSNII